MEVHSEASCARLQQGEGDQRHLSVPGAGGGGEGYGGRVSLPQEGGGWRSAAGAAPSDYRRQPLISAIAIEPTKYRGHSLRTGLATSAAAGGASERSIMQQGGWKSERIARGYIRKATLFGENAADCGLSARLG